MKTLKKQTPDFLKSVWDKSHNLISAQVGIRNRDLVEVIGSTQSLLSGIDLTGRYYFNSYDTLDGSCYISPTESGSFTFNVRLDSIERVYTWKDTIPNRN